jgi:hypothetical protein
LEIPLFTWEKPVDGLAALLSKHQQHMSNSSHQYGGGNLFRFAALEM